MATGLQLSIIHMVTMSICNENTDSTSLGHPMYVCFVNTDLLSQLNLLCHGGIILEGIPYIPKTGKCDTTV